MIGINRTTLYRRVYDIHTDMIRKEFIARITQYHEVSFFTHLDTTNSIGTPDSGCTIERKCRKGLFGRHAHVNAREVIHEGDGCTKAAPGVEVTGNSHSAAVVYHLTSRSISGF